MADARDVFGRGLEFHRHDGFGNQFGGHRADDVHAEDFIGGRIGQEFHHARSVAQRARTAVGHEREGTGLVGDAFGLQGLLGLADPRDFRRGVDHPRNRVEVGVTVLAGDTLGHGNAFFFRLVRQHRAAHDVAHRPHVRQVGLAVAVDGDEAAFVQLQADLVGTQTIRVRRTADRDDQFVEHGFLRFALGVHEFHGDVFLAWRDGADLATEVDLQALLDEQLRRFLGDLLVDGAQEDRQAFEHGDVGTQAAPDAAHFQTDHAGTDDAQLGWNGVDGQCARVRQDQFLVEWCTRQFARVRTRGDDHMLGRQGFVGCARHADVIRASGGGSESGAAVEEGDLVLLEQVQDAVVVLLDDGVLALEHLAQIQLQAGDVDAVLGEAVARVFKMLGRLQQRFRRDAADVGAGTARRGAALGVRPLVDASDGKAQLRCADGGDVAARARTDDHYVKLFSTHVLLFQSLRLVRKSTIEGKSPRRSRRSM